MSSTASASPPDGSPRAGDARRVLTVLYLAPAAAQPGALVAQSFIEEEIRAVREWNVQPYVLTDTIRDARMQDGIAIVGLPRPRSPASLLSLGAHALGAVTPLARCLAASWEPSRLLHVLRLEHHAAVTARRHHVDLIHSHFGWPGGFGGSLAAQWAGLPLVASMRGTDVLVRPDLVYGLRLDPSYDLALRHLFSKASRILTATRFMHRATVSLGAHPDKVAILDKGVDTVRFTPPTDRMAAKAALGLTGPTVLAVGSLKRRKGFDLLIDALETLRQDTWTAVICGTGEERSALERRASGAGLASRIRFGGQVSRAEIPAYFSATDVFVHPAELEAAGNVVLEALAAGCAVVCTDSGGPSEYIEDGRTGFVVPVGDVAALADRVGQLVRQEDLRRRFAESGRRRVEASHTYSRMMRDLRKVYEEVLVSGSTFDRGSQ